MKEGGLLRALGFARTVKFFDARVLRRVGDIAGAKMVNTKWMKSLVERYKVPTVSVNHVM